MAGAMQRIESNLEAMTRVICRHRLVVLLVCLVVLGGLFSRLPTITFDPSTEGFFRADDPLLLAYEAFRDQFGRDELVIMALNPPEVFDDAFLRTLREFHEALENEVPHVKEVNSLINARVTRGDDDALVVGELLERWPETPHALAALREQVMSNPLFPNLLISEDGRFTTVAIETNNFSAAAGETDLLSGFDTDADSPAPGAKRSVLTDAENSEVVAAVRAVKARFEGPNFPIYLAGSPVVTDTLKRAMQQNMGRFLVLAVAAIGVFLFLLFRRVAAVVFPLVIVLLSLATTLSLMAIAGVALKLPTTILPSFILAVGVGASVHILTIFFREFDATGDKENALAHAIGHSGLPVFMTSLTTAVGLGSFMTAFVAPIADLGLFAGLGVLVAMVLTLILLPATLALVPLRPRGGPAGPSTPSLLDRLLVGIGDFSTHHWKGTLAVAAGLTLVAGAGLARLNFSHNTLLWFPASHEIRQASEKIDAELRGSLTMEFVIDTGRENGLYEVELLRTMDAFAAYAEAYRDPAGERVIGKTIGLNNIVKEIHRALNEDRLDYYAIPDNRQLIAQELLLFENSGSDDLEGVVDSQFRLARLTAKVPWRDAATYVDMVEHLEAKAKEMFAGQAEVRVTGLLPLLVRAVYHMMLSTAVSYAIAAGVITLMMLVMMNSLTVGLLTMIPNLFPIVLTVGFMGWAGIRLDMFTMLIGSIAIGLAVDDTIHFFHNYRRYRREGHDTFGAVRETMLGTGRAMLITTLVLVSGFWLFMFATMDNLFLFGLLTGLCLIVALLADFTIAPALCALHARWEKPIA